MVAQKYMPDINTYIQQSRLQGMTDEQIKQGLFSAGWQEEQINQAFGSGVPVPPPAPSAGSPMTPANKKLFMIIGGVVMLLVIGGVVASILTAKKTGSIIPGVNFDDKGMTINTPDGTLNFSNQIPKGWPKDVPIYPGSKIINSATMNQDPSKGGSGIVLTMNTNDNRQTVRDYYKKELVSNGWTIDQDNEVSVIATLVASKNGRGFSLMLGPGEGIGEQNGNSITLTVSDKTLSNSATSGNNSPSGSSHLSDSNQTQNNCGFTISPPKGWDPIDSVTFRNNAMGSDIKLSCKPNAFESSGLLVVLSAQKMMMIPDSGFYTTSIEDIKVGERKAYLIHDTHAVGGVRYFEMILMVDSGIKDSASDQKDQMDIMYAYIPEQNRAGYEPILKSAFYSYKR